VISNVLIPMSDGIDVRYDTKRYVVTLIQERLAW
jgi:hypothetical protein